MRFFVLLAFSSFTFTLCALLVTHRLRCRRQVNDIEMVGRDLVELDAEMDIMSPETGPLSMYQNALDRESMICPSLGFV